MTSSIAKINVSLKSTSLSSKNEVSKSLRATTCQRVPIQYKRVVVTQALAGRREASLLGLAAFTISVLPTKEAQAGLFGPSGDEKYLDLTGSLTTQILDTISLPRDDESRPEAIKKLKEASNLVSVTVISVRHR